MKKTIASLASASLVVALGLSLVAPVGAQTYGSTNSSVSSTTGTTDTTGTTGTTDTSNSSNTLNSSATDTSGTMSSSSTTPGLPNTGAGGDAAMNFAILLGTGLLAVGGSVLLARKVAA